MMWPFKKRPERLCVECRHYDNRICKRPVAKSRPMRLVDGIGTAPSDDFCSIERGGFSSKSCGPSGKYWEAK